MTRDEVIKALECCILRDPDDKPRCGDCPYPSGSACGNRLKVDALALLKQEPKRGLWINTPGYFTPGGDPVWRCSECGKGIHVYGIEHGTYGADISDGQWVACPNCGAQMNIFDEE